MLLLILNEYLTGDFPVMSNRNRTRNHLFLIAIIWFNDYDHCSRHIYSI